MKCIYILSKQEFTSLYRFGSIPIITNQIIPISNKREDEVESAIFHSFKRLPPFSGDEEYLIIVFENSVSNDNLLGIENLLEIIPMTKAAKSSYEMKFDAKLDFREPRFEMIIHKVEEEIDIKERYQGVKVFWKLCGIQNEFEPLVSEEIIRSAYRKRIEGIKSNEFTDEFLTHLLVYERYEFFPNSDLGFFYDVGEIFAHTKGKPTFRGSNLHSFLEKNKTILSSKSFSEIASIISGSEEISSFKKQLLKEDTKQYIAAATFLKFKKDLSDLETIKGSETGKLIGELRKDKKFINELNLAVFLTGLFFGYQKFYDDFYQLVGLNIFKKEDSSFKISKSKTYDRENKLPNTVKEKEDNEDKTLNEKNKLDKKEKSKENQKASITENSGRENNTGIQNRIFESLQKILKEENNQFELKTDRLNELKKILLPLSPNKGRLLKADVVKLIQLNFGDKVEVEFVGNKRIIREKRENDLFNNIEN